MELTEFGARPAACGPARARAPARRQAPRARPNAAPRRRPARPRPPHAGVIINQTAANNAEWKWQVGQVEAVVVEAWAVVAGRRGSPERAVEAEVVSSGSGRPMAQAVDGLEAIEAGRLAEGERE